MSKYDAPNGPPPNYGQQQHFDAGPVHDSRGPTNNSNYYGSPAPPQQVYGGPGYNMQGPPQGYYPPQQGGYYQQQQPMYYQHGPPPGGRDSSGSAGCCAGIMGALACCCCLDFLF